MGVLQTRAVLLFLTASHVTWRALQQSSIGFLPGAIDSFGNKLIDPLLQESGGQDGVFLSPYGVSQAFALLLNGVQPGSESDRQLKSVVFSMSDSQSAADLNSQFQQLNGQLRQVSLNSSLDVSLNNSVWLPLGYQPVPAYQSAIQQYYGAPVRTAGGAGAGGFNQAAAATLTIKISQSGAATTDVALESGTDAARICSSLPSGFAAPAGQPCLLLETQFDGGALGPGKLTVVTAAITLSLAEGDYSRAALLLANAIVFNGLWEYAFSKAGTKPSQFSQLSGETTRVAMMSRSYRPGQIQVAQYSSGSTPCIAVQLLYKGSSFSAVAAMAWGNVTTRQASAGGGQGAGCACAADGVSGGVQTNRTSCAQHLLSQGDTGYFCYVADPSACSSAKPSTGFAGAAWVDCGPSAPLAGSNGGASSGSTELVFEPTGAPYATALAACRSQLLTRMARGSSSSLWSSYPGTVSLRLPRFEIEFAAGLKGALAQLGLTEPFKTDGGDITGIATAPNGQALSGLFVSNVYHRTKAKVDEAGTEAVSATTIIQASPAFAVAAPPTALPAAGAPTKVLEVFFDRPFAVALQHNPSATALFVGEVQRPEPGS